MVCRVHSRHIFQAATSHISQTQSVGMAAQRHVQPQKFTNLFAA
ncbi:hypothetical protein [Kingella negevensis]|nr:hypothetical protein [Kingella negevensis]MDK4692312.1 hypothetical protein [Kingella negevensis]MDK4696453.1 hypothetical protein [Kingella negevensis]MDK4698614.1 hypothetical protein [Kingella negevensis]MDK4707527.1 hypothetical protein [Kingella negevensis]MDK4709997.1 hypothetical protein [Kingella negevensis]